MEAHDTSIVLLLFRPTFLKMTMDVQRDVVLWYTRMLAMLRVLLASFRTPICTEGPFLYARIASRAVSVVVEDITVEEIKVEIRQHL
jgi:hypothetical protein